MKSARKADRAQGRGQALPGLVFSFPTSHKAASDRSVFGSMPVGDLAWVGFARHQFGSSRHYAPLCEAELVLGDLNPSRDILRAPTGALDVSPGLQPWVGHADQRALKERQTGALRAKWHAPIRLPFQGMSHLDQVPRAKAPGSHPALPSEQDARTENRKPATENRQPRPEGARFFSFLLLVFGYDTPAWQ